MNRGYEPVAAPRQGLDELRLCRSIAENRAQPLYRRVQAVLEIDERILALQFVTQFVARHQRAGGTEQAGETRNGCSGRRNRVSFLISSPDRRSRPNAPNRNELRIGRGIWHG